jgi:hypothetical protein
MGDRGLLGVGDPVPGRHQRELPGAEPDVAAEGVAVVDLALEQPRHRLQPGVRMRRDLHAGPGGDVVGAVVVDERPRTHHPPSQGGQQPAHPGALAEQHLLAGQQVERRAGGRRLQPAQLLGRRTAVEVAHGFSPGAKMAILAPYWSVSPCTAPCGT